MAEPSRLSYRAFLSYSHADTPLAKRLHRRLETFPIGPDLAGRTTPMGPVPGSLRPIFRDREEFAAGQSLTEQTGAALDRSAALVVLCSPASARSLYVNEEVRLFKLRHPDRPVIPVIANVATTSPEIDCFPPALRFEIDPAGAVTDTPAAVLAADLREDGDGEELALAKIVARLIGLGTDEVFRRAQREQRLRQRRWIAGLSAIAVALAGLGLWAEFNRREAVVQREAAVRNLAVAKQGADTVIFEIAQSLRNQEGMRVETVRTILGSAERSIDQLTASSGRHPQLLRSQAAMLIEFADTYAAQGDVGRQEEAVSKSLAILEGLLAAEPESRDWQSDLTVATGRTGDVLMTRGKPAEALTYYEKCRALADRVAAAAPADRKAQHILAGAHERLANALTRLSRPKEALASYETSRDIVERIAAAEPANTLWQRDLAVAHNKIANAHAGQGKHEDALASYRRGLAILEKLSAGDPGNALWQNDVAITEGWIAHILANQGNAKDAVPAFRKSIDILERLARADPDNAERQRLLADATQKLAEALADQGDLEGALALHRASRERLLPLLERHPENGLIQRLTGSAIRGVGDVLLAKGDPAEALLRYDESLAILEHVAVREPGNPERQQDLAQIHAKAGEAAQAAGKLTEALKHQEASLAIAERLAGEDSSNTDRQSELAAAHSRVGIVLVLMEQSEKAKSYFLEARKILTSLLERDPGVALWRTFLENIEKLLAAL